MSLSPGTRLGPYEITAQIGVGGMGEVYRATDTNLKRQVAIKVLPESVAGDAERLARFQREAEVLASLNHPNIAAIYGLEESPAEAGHYVRALVMELVEGPTLADRIASAKSEVQSAKSGHGTGLPVDEALAIAKQIAEALEAAHEQGIIHRDLKPANIKVRPDGTVKVLDFGLAKAMEPASALRAPAGQALSQLPTITTPAMTQAGMILGTAAYMSPEQARGKPVDKRTDIWAFGCVLYEMLTAHRAFEGEDFSEAYAGVITLDPAWDALPALPPLVDVFLRQSLKKDPRQRLADIQDMRLALEGSFVEPRTSPAVTRRAPRSFWRQVLPAAAVLAGVAAVVTLSPRPLGPARDVVRFQIQAPPDSSLPLGVPTPSPDGRTLAFVVTDPDGVNRVHLRPIDRTDTQVVRGTDNVIHLFWAPDGRSIAFVSMDPPLTLKRADIAGAGAPVRLAEPTGPWHGSWSPRGDLLFSAAGIAHMSADGGAVTRLVEQELDTAAGFPAFLPDGERFLFYWTDGDASSIQLGRLGSMERTVVVDDVRSAPVLAPTPDGAAYLLFMRGADLVAQEFDLQAGRVSGTASVLVAEIGRVANPLLRPAVGASAAGVLAYQQRAQAEIGNLQWMSRSGAALDALSPEASVTEPRLSPDGRFVAGERTDATGNIDIWVTDLASGISRRVTFDEAYDTDTIWSPDGRRLAYRNWNAGTRTIVVAIDDVDQRDVVFRARSVPTSWSPDGAQVLVTRSPDVLLVTLNSESEPVSVGSPNAASEDGQFSPDGRLIAYISNETGRNEVYVRPVPPGAGARRVSTSGGTRPRWSPAGGELFYVGRDNVLTAVEVEALPDGLTSGPPRPLFPFTPTWGYDVASDGERFMIFRLSPAASGANAITVVTNWWRETEP